MQSTYIPSLAKGRLYPESASLISGFQQKLFFLANAFAQCCAPTNKITVRQGFRQGHPIWFVYRPIH